MKALFAPALSWVLKMLLAFGAGGSGIRTGTGSTRGSRHGLPLIIRSLRSSQNLRCPSAWKYAPDPSSGQAWGWSPGLRTHGEGRSLLRNLTALHLHRH